MLALGADQPLYTNMQAAPMTIVKNLRRRYICDGASNFCILKKSMNDPVYLKRMYSCLGLLFSPEVTIIKRSIYIIVRDYIHRDKVPCEVLCDSKPPIQMSQRHHK